MRRRIDLTWGWADADEFGDSVDVGDREVLTPIEVTFPGKQGQPSLRMLIDSSTGVPRCTDLQITSVEGGREVRTSDLRNVELENWLEAIVPLFMNEFEEVVENGKRLRKSVVREADSNSPEVREARRVLQAARKGARKTLNDEFLRKVADTYRSDPDRPARAVEVAFRVARRTAFKYIQLARERGFLEED